MAGGGPPDTGFFRRTENGVLLVLRVTPNAGRDAVEGVEIRDGRSMVLCVRVAAVPDKGRANAAVIALLAKALSVPRSSLSIASGETSRMKTVAISGDAQALCTRLAALTAVSGGPSTD